MLRWSIVVFGAVVRPRAFKVAVAVMVSASALVSAPAHAEAQFWEDIFRSNRSRRAAAPPPPAARFYAPRRAAATAPGRSNEARDTPSPSVASSPSASGRTVPAVAVGDPSSKQPLFAVISIEDQHLSLYGAAGLIERSNISSGTRGNPTPTGIFGVTQKNRWHESNLYSGAEMPFMQRLTWGGIALHQGRLPGYPASHGCIRLPGAFASKLFGLTRPGFRVVIAPYDVDPTVIRHSLLPQPRYWTQPAGAISSNLRPVRTAGLGATGGTGLLEASPQSQILLDPVAYAALERSLAKEELKEAEAAESNADKLSDAAAKRAKAALAALRSAEKRAAAALRLVSDLGLAGSLQPRQELDPGFPSALIELGATTEALEVAILAEETTRAEAVIARDQFVAAEKRVEWLRQRIVEMGRRQESVSILISRKNQRLYVRQALKPVFDIPITIREPDEPIGNHAFIAIAPVAGAQELRWQSISMPVEDRPPPRSQRRGSAREDEPLARAVRLETASGALDRIEFPGEVLDRLSELVWTGSSILITDHGPGHDGANGHDFAIETRH